MIGTNFIHSQGPKAKGFSRFVLSGFVCLAFFSQSFGLAARYGQLSVKAGHIVNQGGRNVQLRGMSMYGWTNACGTAFYNAGCINSLAQDWKCTVIRMPYQTNGSIPMTQINAVIKACIDNGIYVIVDWHGGSPSSADTTAAFFKTVATQWHAYPNIMYEPWNEPTVAWSKVKPYMETVIAAIRAIDSTNIIICGTPNWSQKPQDAAPDLITDYTNIAYSMHFYAASQSVDAYSPGITTAIAAGCAIFITEYGTCNANGGAPIDLTATQAWYDFLDKNAIGSTNWGVECYDTGGAAAFQKNASITGPWTDYDLTESGKFVKAYIAGHGCACMDDFPQSINAPMVRGVLTKADNKPIAVYTINGVRRPAGEKLPNGLYIFQSQGKTYTKCFNIIP